MTAHIKSKLIHWGMLALSVAALAVVELGGTGEARHASIGAWGLALAVVFSRLFAPKPPAMFPDATETKTPPASPR